MFNMKFVITVDYTVDKVDF